MEIVYIYSHLGGQEILIVRHPAIYSDLLDVVRQAGAPQRTKRSRERTMKGKMLYSPKDLNRTFKDRFHERSWTEIKDVFTIEIPNYPHTIPGAFKQCDFFKEGVLAEVQFGKYAFMFYDLAKFQYFFNRGMIRVGVEIVPCHFLHKQMSTGVSYGEQLVYDLERLSNNFPSVPVMIVLVDMTLETDDYFLGKRREVRTVHAAVQQQLERSLLQAECATDPR